MSDERYLGEKTPKLGFGFMRLPKLEDGSIDIEQSKAMVDRFMDAGLTYFDTAYVYDNGGSERALKEALVDRYPRDAYTIATKVNTHVAASAEDARRQLEVSLERTGAGYFDYYLLHAIQPTNVAKYDEYGLWDFVKEQKERGLVRHWGFSFHGSPELLDSLLTEHPDVEFVQLQINYADWEHPEVASRANYEVARKHGKPIVIMEPVKGGMLASPIPQVQELLRAANPNASFASWAIRYAASLDGIITVLSGMSNLEQIDDNISFMRDFKPLSSEEQKVIAAAQQAFASIESIPCTACRYCTEGCPMHIPIPQVFSARNKQLVWGLDDKAKQSYEEAVGAEGAGRAGDCIACGQCEEACPQHIKIIDWLRDCAAAFEGQAMDAVEEAGGVRVAGEAMRGAAAATCGQAAVGHHAGATNHRISPDHIEVRGARVHNLKNIDVDIPLGCLVGIAGVSGSGKSSLALGTLYAEGSRRYLDALSTYTRRRIAQTGRATVGEVLHVPAALALRQRPGIPGVHSTFGTSTELLNYLRLLFSRLGSHVCPVCGEHVPPSMDVALGMETVCPACGAHFMGPGAEDLAFNSGGACPTCGGTGIVRTVNEASLVPDESISIDDGAVLPWGSLMWDLMKQVCGAMGVRTNVPFCELTPEERDIVFHGPAVKKHILYHPKKGDDFAELDFTYFNAVYTVENALSKVKDEKGLARVSRFLCEDVCPDCHGTRLSAAARGTLLDGMNLGEATCMTLDELAAWVPTVPSLMPEAMQPMAAAIVAEMREPIERLQQLGLGYLSLDRASSTLSTGERQRVQLARAVRNRTCGVLYVLDEPSIGLHPSNVEGLLGVVDDLLDDGNSVVLVDHDVRVLRRADHLIEIGPGSGAAGGRVIAQGSVAEVEASPATRIGPFLTGARRVRTRERARAGDMFACGEVRLATDAIHTVKPLEVRIPRGRLVAVTGVSGSGKTTLVLESLIPALRAQAGQNTPGVHVHDAMPAHVKSVDAAGIKRANLIDATPIGANVRSTVATYSGVLDDLRRAYAKTPEARERGLKAGAFSYNTGSLRCPTCDGTGQISLDVQFLPDVDIPCPDCGGSRYGRDAALVRLAGDISLPELLSYTVDQALEALGDTGLRTVKAKLSILRDLGLGYLTLGEATPALSGGEAQRLKLASELTRNQEDALFVFDEPTIGLHPLDVEVLLGVLQRLIDNGATVVVIEHDLDMIVNADYVIDLGPGGGEDGGRVVAAGTPEEVAACPESITGRYIAEEL